MPRRRRALNLRDADAPENMCFWEMVEKGAGPDDCWVWAGPRSRGYGTAYVGGEQRYAEGLVTITFLAREYGVGKSQIWRIVTGESR